MRRAFAEILSDQAAKDDRVAFITGDLGFQVFDEFEKRFPGRYINVGVAEAQMVYTAAGMAIEGWRPVAYSIASFATARPFEQIRYCLAYPALPVILVGAGRGYLYSTSGVSHHAGDDLALMSSLPGMTVVAPGDPNEIKQLFPQLIDRGGPAYFTVGKFGEPEYTAEEPAILGKGRKLRTGERIAVLSTGEIANEVLKAFELLKGEQIYPAAYQFHTVKPLDHALLSVLAQEFEHLVIVEEHLPNGGLWAAVCQWAATAFEAPRLSRLGVPDRFILGNLKQEELRRRYGLDARAIASHCQQLWTGKRASTDSNVRPAIERALEVLTDPKLA